MNYQDIHHRYNVSKVVNNKRWSEEKQVNVTSLSKLREEPDNEVVKVEDPAYNTKNFGKNILMTPNIKMMMIL